MCDVNKFKVGDVVKCVDNEGYEQRFRVGVEYKVLSITTADGMLMIEDDNNKETICYSYRFELSNSGSANAQQTHKSPKFKVEVVNDVF